MIRFTFRPEKALDAIRLMLAEQDGLDFHTILKAAYFADKESLNERGRPVFGATYRAMNYGPVPLEIYEMIKSEPLWLFDLGRDCYPWRTEGFRVLKIGLENLPYENLSEEDLEFVQKGFEKSRQMSFNARTRETHGKDWLKANLGMMAYEDMLDEDHPQRDEVIDELTKLGPRLVL